ncbi:MAG TPA: sigma-70 family RNA polymerase sigma factor [Solirubrobacteraceae bacterium]|nr:sigma-70 family RNA polymerase sigma factor [Solirubrobacteraceae bacterium]
MAEVALASPDPAAAEAALVERLRAGDEAAFQGLVAGLYGTMLTVARTYVKDRAVAEEVVQETWLGVIEGLERFEGRSSLKTWILSILVNQARTRGTREARSVPSPALAPADDAPAVDPERFRGPHEQYPGGWRAFPASWKPADQLAQDRETIRVAMRAIADLPLTQQTVIRMRDVEGYRAEEVCATLGVSEADQRVLLHRARSRVRSALERHIDG